MSVLSYMIGWTPSSIPSWDAFRRRTVSANSDIVKGCVGQEIGECAIFVIGVKPPT